MDLEAGRPRTTRRRERPAHLPSSSRCLGHRGKGLTDEIGSGGTETIGKICGRVATVRPVLSARLQDEERERIELTRKQTAVLAFLARQRRVMIAGGAGTGKTLIAREKAVRLAEEG